MTRSQQDLLQVVYRRSRQIRRRRAVRNGTSGLAAAALVVSIVVPLSLRSSGTAHGNAPPIAAPSTLQTQSASPAPGVPRVPCSCMTAKPGTRPPGLPSPAPTQTRSHVRGATVLAFASDRDGTWQIYRQNADGSGLRRLTHSPDADRDPAWSPDGRRIAFVRLGPGHLGDVVGDIYVMNADGSGLRLLTTKGGGPQWSPDGRRLVFSRYTMGSSGPLFGEIRVVNADGSGERLITTNGADPSWAPDGRHIVFGGLDSEGVTNVIRVGIDGSQRTMLTHNPAYACQPVVSPDGNTIAYVAAGDTSGFHIELIDWAAQSAPMTLTHNAAGLEASPAWSPDGTMIAFEHDPDGDPHYASLFGNYDQQGQPSFILLVDADGSDQRRLTPENATYSDADPAVAPGGP